MATFAGLESTTVGDIRITHLPDGGGYLSATMLLPPSSEEDWAHYPQWLDDEGRLFITIGGILIDTPTAKILVDPGVGPQTLEFPPMGGFGGGELLRSLAAVGLTPADIDIVTFSHLHVDHVGWTIQPDDAEPDGLVFPHARHVVLDQEWDYWQHTDDPLRSGIERVLDGLAGTVELVEAGLELAPGISLLHTPGHTPGHAAVSVRSGNEHGLLLGDAIHSGAQVSHCGWHCVGDVDGELASKTRERLVHELSASDTFGVTAHFPNTVFGRVLNRGGEYEWSEGRA